MNLSQVKAAAERKMKGPIGLEEQNTLAYFALAAIPMIEAAEKMAGEKKRGHYDCEDAWYSCPLSSDGCSDERQEGCTCGADELNKNGDLLRAALAKLRESTG